MLNSSHSRNGTAIRNLEEPLTSIGFHRQSQNKASSQKNSKNLPPSPTLFNGGSSLKLLGENNESEKYKFHPLVLVEDVDILYAEDRGCIAAIQQIVETSKGPIILTSNSDNLGLPHKFDRFHVPFVLPSPKELLSHLYTVCLTEGVNIHPLLVEKFIHSCGGDIRKSIMHLQFWFQSKTFQKACTCQIKANILLYTFIDYRITYKRYEWQQG
ncbi:unnamed protein product [Sphenostylis stenocarpa]|uniref:Uncharacterized protein n=1 Tax=Sphenostylis stenocarpa TaxID=92480 RepID=A0AA86W467_9FABA|nr:unnamed protein product [Sphenostylis stenocarpa]